MTTAASWSTANADVASISATGNSCVVTGTGLGTTMITATYTDGMRGSATLTVTPAVLVALDVTPTNPSIALGTTRQFAATGSFSDDTVQDLTSQVTWASSAPSVATADNSPGNAGLATSHAAGTTTISATHTATSIVATTTLSVSAAVLVGLDVTPTNPSIALGTTQQFVATGTFSDSSTQDLTNAVTWTSPRPAVATIGSGGLATSVAIGSTAITATHPATTIFGTTTLTVTPAVLDTVTVTPASPSIALGTTQQFVATGTFSDSSTQNLTTSVTWSTSQPAVATISNLGGSEGLATSASTGTATITATHPGSGLFGSTPLTVTPATLVSIAVTPGDPEVLTGSTRQLTATGTYSDTSTQDITAQVTWSSSVTAAATVSNAGGSEGLVTGVAVGTTTVTATHAGTAVFGDTTVNTLPDITLRAATSNGEDSGILTLTITTPAGTEVDDVLVAAIALRPSTAVLTPPSGWVLVRRLDNSSTNANSLAIFTRIAVASEPTNHAWTLSASTGSAGGIMAFVGVDPSDPVVVEDGQITPWGLAHTAPSIAIGSAGAMLVTMHGFSSSSFWTAPPGMTPTFQGSSILPENGAGISMLGSRELRTSPGATGSRIATALMNADTGNAAALALRRAP